VSGAETLKLINRQRLLDALSTGRAPVQVLMMRDASRFSRRDGDEAFGKVKRIAQAGVKVWFYQDGTRFEYGNFAANITGIVRAEMNAEFRVPPADREVDARSDGAEGEGRARSRRQSVRLRQPAGQRTRRAAHQRAGRPPSFGASSPSPRAVLAMRASRNS